ncbi:MAG: N-acetyltransferase [Syntrophomonadaceae bacterium]|nr:N-acetyltransferase [Syntrophomonadaceae bacterium]
MIIRREIPEEFPQIYDLVKAAFQTAQVSNGKEQDFVNQLRCGGSYIPELALVAEENGRLIGHVMLTKTYIVNDRNKFEALLMAPLSVALGYRSQGIGSGLIREGFRVAGELGYTAVLLVGNPEYYHRFGFKTASGFGLKHTQNIPDQYVMACELVPGAFKSVRGIMGCC